MLIVDQGLSEIKSYYWKCVFGWRCETFELLDAL